MAGSAQTAITSTTYTDLGAAPAMVQVLGPPVSIAVADSIPTATSVHIIAQPGAPLLFYKADAGSHVWAATFGGISSMIASSVISTLTA